MPTALSPVMPVNHPNSHRAAEPRASAPPSAPTRVIEIGEVAAGIAVPEERGVRFFSASHVYDGLDGMLFRSPEQAARAARALARPGARRTFRPMAV